MVELMITRTIKMPEKAPDTDATETETPPNTQRKPPETGRYLLQVDRQTKGSYATAKDAEVAGQKIKKGHPIVQVTVYDRIESQTTIVSV
jgi:hypothetical protein